MNFEKLNQRNEWSDHCYLFGQWIWVRKSDDILPGLQKKYIRGKNPVPLVVWLEPRRLVYPYSKEMG